MTRGRWTALFVTVVAVTAGAVAGLPRAKRWGEEALRRSLEKRLAAIVGGSASIGRVRAEFYPTTLHLESIEVLRHGNRGSEAGATIDEVSLRAGLLTFLHANRGPFTVRVKRPHLRVHFAEGRPFAGGSETSVDPTALAMIPAGSTLEVRDGMVEVDREGGPSARIEGLLFEAGPQPIGGLAGHAEFSSAAYHGPGGDWTGLSGAADFQARSGEIRLSSLSIHSEGIGLSGRVTLLTGGPLSVEGALDAGIEIDKLARFFPEGASPAGHLKVALTGGVRDGKPQARGDLEVTDLTLWGLTVGTLRSDLIVDDAVHLKGIRAHLLGGEATGSSDIAPLKDRIQAAGDLRLDGIDAAQILEYAGWGGPPLTGTIHYSGQHTIDSNGLESLRGSGVIDAVGHVRSARGEDLPLEVTTDLSSEGETLRLVNGSLRAGSTRAGFSGTVTRGEGIRLKLSGGTGNLSEILPLFAPSRKKPAAGKGEGPAGSPQKPPRPRARPPGAGDRSTRPASFRISSPASSILLATWPPRGASRVAAADRAATRPALSPDSEAEAPLERILDALGGRWEWDGDLGYDKGGLAFTGTLRGVDLTYHGAPIGSVQAGIVYRSDVLAIEHAALRLEPDATIDLEGRIDFRGEGSVSLAADATRFPLGPILDLIGAAAPVEGRLSGRIDLGGRPGALTGRARVEGAPVAIAGVAFDSVRGDLVFTPELLEMRPLLLTQGAGRLQVDGRIPYRDAGWLPQKGEEPPHLILAGTDLQVSAWTKTLGGLALDGKATLEGRVSGALSAPEGTITVRAEGATARGLAIGDVGVRVDLSRDTATVDLQAPGRGLTLGGTIGLGPGKPVDLRATLSATDVRGEDLWRGLSQEIRVSLGGEIRLRGPLGSPEALEGRAMLDHVRANLSGVVLDAQGPVEATLSGGALKVAPLVLTGEGTRIELRGALDPGAAGSIDVSAGGTFDLRLLPLFVKNLQASGQGKVSLTIGGPLAAPVFQGRVQVEAQAMRHPDLPFPIDTLRCSAVFEESRLRVDSFDFLAGGGPVTGTGTIELGDRERSESPFTIGRATIRLHGSNVKTEFPAGFRSTADMDLVLRAEDGATSLSGEVDLVRGVYSKDFKFDAVLGGTRASEVFASPATGVFPGIALDLVIRATQDVWLRNDFGTLEGQGELRIRGTTDHPSLAGRISAVEGGTIRFRRVPYRILTGTVDFADPQEVNPIFDLQADTQVSEYQVTLQAEGTLDDFHYELSSNPPLPEQDIVALLLTGRTLGPINSEGGTLAEETISSVTGQFTGELTGRFSGRTGIDVLTIDPLQVNAKGDPTTRITVGKQVTRDLFVAYSSDVGSTQGSVYQLDYALDRDFHFTSIRDQDGSVGGDFKYILRGRPPASPGAAGPAAAPRLGAIHLDGVLRFKERTVRRRLRVREGRKRDRAAIYDGVDRLVEFYRRHGYWMAEVDYHEAPGAVGAVDATYHVRTGPRVTIELRGTGGKSGIRQEIAPLWQRGLFMDDIVEQARTLIEKRLRDRAYLKVSVAAEVLSNDPDRFQVRFTVQEGPRARASSVQIAGTGQLQEREVRRAIRTSPDGWFTRGLVRESVLTEDAAAIWALYLTRGFPTASVPPPAVSLDDSGRHAQVTFRIEEGPQILFGRPHFEGHRLLTAEELEFAAGVPKGAPYSVSALDAATVRLRRFYDTSGYPDARVTVRPLQVAPGGTGRVEEPVFVITEGAHQRVGEVSTAGNVLTRDHVIRKALRIEPARSLSRGGLLAGQTRLYGLGIFQSVSVEPEPPSEPHETTGASPAQEETAPPPADVRRDVRVSVRELAPLTQAFGLGYDSEERLRGQYEISNRNIFGSGRYLGLQARASRLLQRGTLVYREKGIFGGRFDVLGSAFGEDERRPAFDVHTVGASIRISRKLTKATRTLYRYTLQDVNLSDASAVFDESTLRLASVAASEIHDTRDAPFDPLHGHYLSGETELFSRGVGSEAEFVKMLAQIYGFKQIGRRTVWAQALRAGAAIPFGVSKKDPASTGDPVSGIPPSERFFAGGDTTVRGFSRDHLGPLDASGDPIGGEGLFLVNEEVRFPIYDSLGGVVFFDAGNVYRTLDDFDVTDLRRVAGAGLRFATPIGPFRVEYGALLDRKEGEARGQFFFSIGQAF